MHIDIDSLYKNFVDFQNIANIKILKCYKVLFNKKYIKKNIGFFISIFIILLHIICIVILFKKDLKLLSNKIDDIYTARQNLKLYEKENKLKSKISKNKKRINITERKKSFSNIQKHKKNNPIIKSKNKKKNKNQLIENNSYIITNNFRRNSNNLKENENNIKKINSASNLKILNKVEIKKILEISKKI